jgi:hypothetical protein
MYVDEAVKINNLIWFENKNPHCFYVLNLLLSWNRWGRRSRPPEVSWPRHRRSRATGAAGPLADSSQLLEVSCALLNEAVRCSPFFSAWWQTEDCVCTESGLTNHWTSPLVIWGRGAPSTVVASTHPPLPPPPLPTGATYYTPTYHVGGGGAWLVHPTQSLGYNSHS